MAEQHHIVRQQISNWLKTTEHHQSPSAGETISTWEHYRELDTNLNEISYKTSSSSCFQSRDVMILPRWTFVIILERHSDKKSKAEKIDIGWEIINYLMEHMATLDGKMNRWSWECSVVSEFISHVWSNIEESESGGVKMEIRKWFLLLTGSFHCYFIQI